MNETRTSASKKMGIFDIFASVKLSIALLLTLAGTSILGTIIPQNESAVAYLRKYEYPVWLYKTLYATGLLDMYRSFWFQFLLLLLAVNLLTCSAKRLPATWKVVRMREQAFPTARVQRMKEKQEFAMKRQAGLIMDKARKMIPSSFGRVRTEVAGRGFTLMAESGRWTRLGPYVVHLGFILVLAGGLIGSAAGWSGYVNIPEGGAIQSLPIQDGEREIRLPFAVKCDDFNVTYYETGEPKEYRSTLTILEEGRPVLTQDILVNTPLRYKGVNLFLSSFGALPPEEFTLGLTEAATGREVMARARMNEAVPLPNGDGTATLDDFRDSFHAHGRDMGAVAFLTITEKGAEPASSAVFLNFPDFDKRRGGKWLLSLKPFKTRSYTGLQVTRDPGVWVVYAGFILVIAGCFITFVMAHRRIWVLAEASGSATKFILAGDATRNRHGFEQRLRRLARAIENSLNQQTGPGEI